MKFAKAVAISAVLFMLMGMAFAWSGLYNIAADAPHSRPVYLLLQFARNRSVDLRAGSVEVPDNLADARRVRDGALLYAVHCEQCHSGPGLSQETLQQGLNPSPPPLHRDAHRRPLAEQFWIVKHGVKMTGMPAWGKAFPDEAIWDMVAFTDRLTKMSPDEFQRLTRGADERR